MNRTRIYYLDHIKILLTSLVILHHSAITYGAEGSWYYREDTASEITAILLTLFAIISQSFVLGLYFFIAGYFTPASFDKKGARKFLIDRGMRLGIPLIFYVFVINPLLLFFMHRQSNQTIVSFYSNLLSVGGWSNGPLWFVQALFIFSVGYMVWKRYRGNVGKTIAVRKFPSDFQIILTSIILGIFAFMIRFVYPVGEEVAGMQLGYFSMYIFMFIAGILVYRHNWLSNITSASIFTWSVLLFLLIVILPVVFIIGGAADEKGELFTGGINIQALFYAMWEPLTAFSIIMLLLHIGKTRMNRTSPFRTSLSRSTYAAYVIHPVVLVFISTLFHEFRLFAMWKFFLVGSMGIVGTFLAASILVKLPLLKRIF